MALSRGFAINNERREYHELLDALITCIRGRNKSENHRKAAFSLILEMREWKKRYREIMSRLPKKFDADYDRHSYKADIWHVELYYSRHTLEDLFLAKKSLQRVRKYEKRERLKPFEIVAIEKKKKEAHRDLLEKGGGFLR